MRDVVKIGVAWGVAIFILCFSLFYAYEPLLRKGIASEHMPAWLQAFGAIAGIAIAFWIGRRDTVARNEDKAHEKALLGFRGRILVRQNAELFVSLRTFSNDADFLFDTRYSNVEKMIRWWGISQELPSIPEELMLELATAFHEDAVVMYEGLTSAHLWNSRAKEIIAPFILRAANRVANETGDNEMLRQHEARLSLHVEKITVSIEKLQRGGSYIWSGLSDLPAVNMFYVPEG